MGWFSIADYGFMAQTEMKYGNIANFKPEMVGMVSKYTTVKNFLPSLF